MQHDHILIKMETENLIEFITEFNSNPNANSSLLCNYVQRVKSDAQITQITFLIQNFKSFLK